MEKDSLHERGRVLEESFFARRNQDLLEQLRAKEAAQSKREAMQAACGIQDDAVLDRLSQLDVAPETIAAFSLVPLVVVAWADGSVAPQERDAVLQAAEEKGFAKANPSYQLLQRWLEDQPPGDLFDAWQSYTAATCQHLSEESRHALRDEIVGRAREVAQAAGGILGVGSVSSSERQVLDRLEKSF